MTYSTGAWGDQLANTTYDAVGNPLTYNGFTMTWSGRQLKSMVKNGGQYSYSFTYNDEGIRTSKTSQGVKHTYMLEGSRIVGEQFGVHFLLYLYDESGAPIGLQYRSTSYAAGDFDTYYFEKNVFGDIIGIYTSAGVKIGTYKYDAWGNCTRTAASGTTALQKQIFNTYNPFRYRGYYYDADTGLYYLQSRYYDPAIGRFITADKLSTLNASSFNLTDKNLYAYCDNNPVTRTDDGGMFWDTVFDVVSLCFSVAEVVATPANPMSWVSLAGDVVDLIPFVSGVGETAKIIGATIKITNAVDNTTDTIKVLKAVDLTEEAIDKVRDLDRAGDAVKSTRSAGQIIHKGYKTNIDVPNVVRPKEHNFGTGNRVDFFDGKSIFELKPMNPQGLRDGIRQLQRYKRASGGEYDLILELYG